MEYKITLIKMYLSSSFFFSSACLAKLSSLKRASWASFSSFLTFSCSALMRASSSAFRAAACRLSASCSSLAIRSASLRSYNAILIWSVLKCRHFFDVNNYLPLKNRHIVCHNFSWQPTVVTYGLTLQSFHLMALLYSENSLSMRQWSDKKSAYLVSSPLFLDHSDIKDAIKCDADFFTMGDSWSIWKKLEHHWTFFFWFFLLTLTCTAKQCQSSLKWTIQKWSQASDLHIQHFLI